MQRLKLKDEDITIENLRAKLNQLFYEIRDLSRRGSDRQTEEILCECLDGSPNGLTGIQVLQGYLIGKHYEHVEIIPGEYEYIQLGEPIDPSIIYEKINQLIDFINDILGIKETDEFSLSDKKEDIDKRFKDAVKASLKKGIENYFEFGRGRRNFSDIIQEKFQGINPDPDDIEIAIYNQFRDRTPSDIVTRSSTTILGHTIERKQIQLSRELARIFGFEYQFERSDDLERNFEIAGSKYVFKKYRIVLEQVTIYQDGNPTTTYECSSYLEPRTECDSNVTNCAGGVIIDDPTVRALIENAFQQIISNKTIEPSEVVKKQLASQGDKGKIVNGEDLEKGGDNSILTQDFQIPEEELQPAAELSILPENANIKRSWRENIQIFLKEIAKAVQEFCKTMFER